MTARDASPPARDPRTLTPARLYRWSAVGGAVWGLLASLPLFVYEVLSAISALDKPGVAAVALGFGVIAGLGTSAGALVGLVAARWMTDLVGYDAYALRHKLLLPTTFGVLVLAIFWCSPCLMMTFPANLVALAMMGGALYALLGHKAAGEFEPLEPPTRCGCGYDLRGSEHTGRCPECGEPIASDGVR